MDAVVALAIILGSLVIHENAHAVVALWLGDPTAKEAGRITLNPLRHLDLVGSLILPVFLYLGSGGRSTFGYAKPVPVNRQRLRGGDRGFAAVALAGPVSNVLIAIAAAAFLKSRFDIGSREAEVILFLRTEVAAELGLLPVVLAQVIVLNVFLAAFNLVPIPPLDGSRLLRPFISRRGVQLMDKVEPYGFVLLFALIYLLREPFFRVVFWIFSGIMRLLPF